MQAGLAISKPVNFGQRAALAGTRVGQKLSHLTTRRVIIGKAWHPVKSDQVLPAVTVGTVVLQLLCLLMFDLSCMSYALTALLGCQCRCIFTAGH